MINVKYYKYLTHQDSTHNMIITSINCEINIFGNKFYCIMDKRIVDKLEEEGLLRKKYAYYKFYIGKKLLTLICPMLKMQRGKNIVFWPSHKLPFRHYPVHVYLYAVAIYLTENISMRKAAEKTRIKYGLPTFSHTTLSRALKRLSQNIRQFLTVIRNFLKIDNCHSLIVKRRRWDDVQTNEYKNILEVIEPVLNEGVDLQFGANLNYRFYNVAQKFII